MPNFTLEEAYGNPTEQDFPSLVPAKRSTPSAKGESFLPGSEDQGNLPKDIGLRNVIASAAEKYGVPEEYAFALAQQESNYDPKVENEIGAKGLYQYIDATSNALGIDPLDPVQSADAAMKDFAQQAKKHGIDWAIKHHFAGPNPKLHGKKTEEYLASVRRRAETIAKELGKGGLSTALVGQDADTTATEQAQTIKPVTPGQTFSLDEAYGPVGKTVAAGVSGGFDFKEDVVDPILNTGKAVFDSIKDRLNNPPQRIERSPEEVEALVNEAIKHAPVGMRGQYAPTPESIEATKRDLREKFRFTDPAATEQEAQQYRDTQDERAAQQLERFQRTKDMPFWQQMIQNIDNPVKNILENSLPSHIIQSIFNGPLQERLKYDELKQTLQRQKILDNPSEYPTEVVQAAKQKDQEIKNKQPEGIRQQWDALKQSATEHPGMFAGQLVNALVADPEMLFAPIGFGMKPIQASRAALTGATTESKIIQLADRIMDTSALGATLSTTANLAEQMATRTHISGDELAFSAAAGGIVGGTLGGILSKGAHAKIKDPTKASSRADLENILKDQAAYDVEIESMARGDFDPAASTEVRDRINSMLGITSKTDRDKWIAQRRKEVKSTFKNESDYADYLQFKAEERIARAEQLASERAAKAAEAAERQAAESAAGFTQLSPETPSGPSPGEVFRVLRKPAHLRSAEDMLLLKQIPKGQRGEIDQKLAARIAAGSIFAAGGYALGKPDYKEETALAAGLAGLLIPGGGRVLDRMRQSGVVSMDGTIPGLAELVKEGRLKPDVEPTAIRAAEAETLSKAKRGDQTAYKKIYEDNFPRLTRYAKQFIKEAGPKLGLDAEDIAQESLIQFFNGINEFRGDSGIYTYLQNVARNTAIDAIRKAKSQKGGGDFVEASMFNSSKDAGPGSAAAGHIMEGENALIKGEVENASADFQSPEFNALYAEAQERMVNAVKKLPEPQQSVFLLNRVEGMTAKDIGEKFGMPINTVLSHLARANDTVLGAIAKDYNAEKIKARPETSAIQTTGEVVKRGRGRPSLMEQALRHTKIVDTAGNPLKVYHGTGDFPIEKFSSEYAGKNTGAIDAREGIFFADDPEFADAFAWSANKGDGSRSGVHEAYLDIRNPVEIDVSKLPQTDISKTLSNLLKQAKQLGHDGAIIKNYHYQEGFKQTEYVVFSPDQIVRKVNNRFQRGEVDPRLLKAGAVAALGVGAYGFLDTENKKLAASIAALGGLALLSRGRTGETLGQGLVKSIDKTLGVTSTRLMNISRPLWWRTMEHFRATLRDTHKYMKEVDPFLVKLQSLKKDQQDFINRAILTGHQGVVQKMIEALGDKELLQGWKQVRGVLDSLGDQLVHLKRFPGKLLDYFPRIVKDYPGLLKALGNEKSEFLSKIVDDANKQAIRNRGTELTELERSLIINKALVSEPKLGGQPGFAKDRTVKEITPELQKFYATPTESLHSYIRSAVEDIERAKFFGKDLQVVEKGGKEYTNIDQSIGRVVDGMMQRGQINEAQAMEVSSMLKSLFQVNVPNELIQKAKNLSYAGLLGNPVSAAGQLGDAVIQTYIQGLRPAISGVVKTLTNRKYVSMKDFGLADHLAEEFVNTEGTAKFLKRVFKVGLFSQLDSFGKNVGLNAAISNAARLARTEGGIQKLHAKYGKVLQPNEFNELVKDLQKGEVTDLVQSIAFAELSRTQPITKLEMPQAYLDHPNGRVLYQFKTFMLKQADVFRRDAYNEIKKGNRAKGIKNLVEFATVLGISGATTSQIQNWLRGRDSELKGSDIMMNALKTFGMSQYILDHMRGVSKESAQERRDAGDTGARATKAEPFQTVMGMALPPAKMFDEIVRGDPNALRYIPIIGPRLLENYKKAHAED